MNKVLLGLFLLPFISISQVSYTVTITELMALADNCDGGAPFCLNAPQDPVFNIWTNDGEANENTNCWIFEDDEEIEYGNWKDIQNLEIANETNVLTSYIKFDMSGFESDNLSPGCSSGIGDDATYDQTFVQQFDLVTVPEGVDHEVTINLDDVYFAKVIIHWIDLTAGTNDIVNELAFSLVPNPSEGIFNVKLGNNSIQEVDISIYDMFGRIVYSNPNQVVSQSIDLSQFESGSYTVSISSEVGIAQEKLIIR